MLTTPLGPRLYTREWGSSQRGLALDAGALRGYWLIEFKARFGWALSLPCPVCSPMPSRLQWEGAQEHPPLPSPKCLTHCVWGCSTALRSGYITITLQSLNPEPRTCLLLVLENLEAVPFLLTQ